VNTPALSAAVDAALPPPAAEVVEYSEPAFARGDGPPDPTLLPLDPAETLDSLGRWLLRTELELAAVRASHRPLIEQLEADIRHYEAKAAYIRSCLLRCTVPGTPHFGPHARITWLQSERVEVTDESLIPDQFVRVERVVSKPAIKDAVAKGECVPGAVITIHQNIQVRAATARAADAARRKAGAE
jgi:hypothetical protein